jgi:hypothetical protein
MAENKLTYTESIKTNNEMIERLKTENTNIKSMTESIISLASKTGTLANHQLTIKLNQERISFNEKQIKQLEEENKIAQLKMNGLQKYYYTISCRPSKSDHCPHTTGLFSTPEFAESFIPEKGNSHDFDDNVTWYYQVSVVSADKISDSEFKDLDTNPYGFPY